MNRFIAGERTIVPFPVLHHLRQFVARRRSLRYIDPKQTESAVGDISPEWRRRIDDVLACPDNQYIPRVPDAGKLSNGFVTMHNGIRVASLGYYGAGNLNLLLENRGVHEPQEERVFGEVLRHIPANSTMLELGAYWGFYSLWFAKMVDRPQCFLIEPGYDLLQSGKLNFEINGCRAVFEQVYVGGGDGKARDGKPILTVDSFCHRKHIEHLAILHSDIQGAEMDMLGGAESMLAGQKIDWLFLSTHSNDLHYRCMEFLKSRHYLIAVSADLNETYSFDGLIVAKCKTIEMPTEISVSRRPVH